MEVARANLSDLLDRVARRQDVVITRDGKPVARLLPYAVDDRKRAGGQWRNRVHIREDFDEPLPGDPFGFSF